MYDHYLAIQELIILLIVVVLLSAAEAHYCTKSWLSWPQGMILAWNRANRRERLAYENWRHVAIGFKLVVLPKLSHTSSCFCRLAMPFKSFATLGTVPPNAENGTAMKPTDSLTKCPYWLIFRFSASLSPFVRSSFSAALRSGWCSALNASSALLGPSSSIKSLALIAFPPACMLPSATSRESWVAASVSSALVAALLQERLLPSPLPLSRQLLLLIRLFPAPLLLAPWLLLLLL